MIFYGFIGPIGPGGFVVQHDPQDGTAWGILAMFLVPWFLSTGIFQMGIAYLFHTVAGEGPFQARRIHVHVHDDRVESWSSGYFVEYPPTSVVMMLSALIPTIVTIFLLFRFIILARAHGGLGALVRLLDFRVPLPTEAETQRAARGQTRAQRAHRIAEVIKAVRSMPVETWRTRDELKAESISHLREHLSVLGLSSEGVLEKEGLVDLIANHGGGTAEQCGICFDEYASGVELRVLPCGHKFHLPCIDRWALTSTEYPRPSSCPMCNAPLVQPVATRWPGSVSAQARPSTRGAGSAPEGQARASAVGRRGLLGRIASLFRGGSGAGPPAAAPRTGARPRLPRITVRDEMGGRASHTTTVPARPRAAAGPCDVPAAAGGGSGSAMRRITSFAPDHVHSETDEE